MDGKIYNKIISKKEFSNLIKKDVEIAFKNFDKTHYIDEEKVKKTRDLLRKAFSVFGSGKLLNFKIVDKKEIEEILKKHISTRERFEYYSELYGKLLKGIKDPCIIDLGCGVNGLSYNYFKKKTCYVGVESVGQFVKLNNYYFKKEKIKGGKSIQASLFDLVKIKEIILKEKKPKILFLFKVIDSLEMLEKNYSKELLKEIVPLVERVVVSFATESLVSRKRFRVKRYWFENFVKENFEVLADFNLGGERYISFKNKKFL
jgi:hypothetical protein|tara:strand:+ start:22 stop:801 length:780 start_codon:yes stop_codon:yes gene_type:complete